MAALLSQKIFNGVFVVICSSSNNIFNHKTSQIPCATDLNSASALLLATTARFLFLHITKFPQTNEQYPDVERLSRTNPTQSASVKTSTTRDSFLLKNKQFPGVPFRYLRIR